MLPEPPPPSSQNTVIFSLLKRRHFPGLYLAEDLGDTKRNRFSLVFSLNIESMSVLWWLQQWKKVHTSLRMSLSEIVHSLIGKLLWVLLMSASKPTDFLFFFSLNTQSKLICRWWWIVESKGTLIYLYFLCDATFTLLLRITPKHLIDSVTVEK